jgi:hypothetical protein
VTAWTSEYSALKHNAGWRRNGAGYWVNSAFGFGLLNAARMINEADPNHWKHVPEKYICYVQSNKIYKDDIKMIIEIHLRYSFTISHQVRQQRYTCTLNYNRTFVKYTDILSCKLINLYI